MPDWVWVLAVLGPGAAVLIIAAIAGWVWYSRPVRNFHHPDEYVTRQYRRMRVDDDARLD